MNTRTSEFAPSQTYFKPTWILRIFPPDEMNLHQEKSRDQGGCRWHIFMGVSAFHCG